jgi:hypothetical protein
MVSIKKPRRKPRGKRTVTSHSEAFPFGPPEITPARHAELAGIAREIAKLRRQAKAAYQRAEMLMDELVEEAGVGREFDLGRGRTGRVVDQLARRSVVYKTTAFSRYDLEILD